MFTTFWCAVIGFLARLFSKGKPPVDLPTPVTAKSPSAASSSTARTPPGPSRQSLASLHTLHSISPTAMSDGSLEVVSLVPARFPSPWSPIGKSTDDDVWMSTDGRLVTAAGPQRRDSVATTLTPTTLSKIGSTSLCSSPSVLNALGISVFVEAEDSQDTDVEPAGVLASNDVQPLLVSPSPQTPCKRRDTLSSAARAHACSTWATKHTSTPLSRLNNADVAHLHSASSVSSMAYEFRMGLFAEGRSIENIISLIDQASLESAPLTDEPIQPVEVVSFR